jgi:hypothetical protein
VVKYLVDRVRLIAVPDFPARDYLRSLNNRSLSHSAKSNCFPLMRVRAPGVALLHVFKYQVQHFQSIAHSLKKTPGRGVPLAEIKNGSAVLYSSSSQGLAATALT